MQKLPKELTIAIAVVVQFSTASFVFAKPPVKYPLVVANKERRFQIYLTGYSYWDNTPPRSASISHPVIHRRAGGIGTYENPITIAVGHVINGGLDRLDFPAGTRFYIPRLRKYTIVEDSCGDGLKPQNGPCHIGHRGRPWLDIYVGGSKLPKRKSERCFNKLTGIQLVVMTPKRGYPVVKGELTASGCKLFK